MVYSDLNHILARDTAKRVAIDRQRLIWLAKSAGLMLAIFASMKSLIWLGLKFTVLLPISSVAAFLIGLTEIALIFLGILIGGLLAVGGLLFLASVIINLIKRQR